MDEVDWADEIIFRKYRPKMELPEDILLMMVKKNPLITELIRRFELEIEY